jgi:phytoene dehydrogenase-like protein
VPANSDVLIVGGGHNGLVCAAYLAAGGLKLIETVNKHAPNFKASVLGRQINGPLPGIYMCGSGTHPGGGVTGAPGHNAAREILIDFRKRKLRRIA